MQFDSWKLPETVKNSTGGVAIPEWNCRARSESVSQYRIDGLYNTICGWIGDESIGAVCNRDRPFGG